ncbi:Hypothetical_protein [Hexamita inflata]|uniref:Hypothetical_protein n=1 Tax=Hexamita inflata TaxID=28002 RepID=A0AA86PSJ9_9EUKA|nr:Hypothetical protein HINF_LOCUS27877 [Hexamita inflata]
MWRIVKNCANHNFEVLLAFNQWMEWYVRFIHSTHYGNKKQREIDDYKIFECFFDTKYGATGLVTRCVNGNIQNLLTGLPAMEPQVCFRPTPFQQQSDAEMVLVMFVPIN